MIATATTVKIHMCLIGCPWCAPKYWWKADHRQHARQHMGRGPDQDRRDVDRINLAGVIPSAPAVTGTKARIGGTKGEEYGKRPAAVEEGLALLDHARILVIGQVLRISRCYRWPTSNAEPSPMTAPAIAAASTPHNFSSPPGTRALSARMMVEPGITAPTTGTAREAPPGTGSDRPATHGLRRRLSRDQGMKSQFCCPMGGPEPELPSRVRG